MLTRSRRSRRVPRGSGLMSRTESGGRILINGMGHPRAVKNLDDVIEEIESRLDEKDEVRELTIKSSRTIARLSGSAIQGMHRGQNVGGALPETREEILKLLSPPTAHPDLYHRR